MSRYIDADVFMKNLKTNEYGDTDVKQVEIAIDKSRADVVEVRHGRWTVKHPEYMSLDRSTDVMECSECGHRILRRTGEIANYCPNCGAKMI